MLAAEVNQSKRDKLCTFRPATIDDAQELVAVYEGVFGKGGVKAPGHEAYPAPEVFSGDGIEAIVNDPNREFVVADCHGEIAAAMIVTHNSPFHREFGCVAVGKKFQGMGISSLMLAHQKSLEQRCSLVINTTEIVTHSLLSQCAHHRAGYNSVTGFGFCQYPHVFFQHHPESCLWITSLEGRVIDWLRQARPAANRIWNETGKPPLPGLNDDEKELLSLLQVGRDIFVPADYFEVVAKIIAQFDDTLSYRVHPAVASAPLRQEPTAQGVLELDLCADAPFAYLTFPDSLLASPAQQFEQVWQDISNAGKRYVQARIPMNSSAAIEHINRLKERGFIFLGLAPLFGRPDFADIFIMQWIAPHVMAKCPLPGETDSVAKLHGYPLNLTGDIVATMRKDRSSPEYKRYATLFHDY